MFWVNNKIVHTGISVFIWVKQGYIDKRTFPWTLPIPYIILFHILVMSFSYIPMYSFLVALYFGFCIITLTPNLFTDTFPSANAEAIGLYVIILDAVYASPILTSLVLGGIVIPWTVRLYILSVRYNYIFD